MNDYRWSPGHGPDRAALQRLHALTRVPKQPMGEAWFMGDTRRMYPALMHDDPAQWPRDELDSALYELASGPVAFGPLREWSLWFTFLLPRALELIGRLEVAASNDDRLLGALITATFVHYPDCERLPANLRQDLLDTLGRAMFAPSLWGASGMKENAFCSPWRRGTPYGDMLDPSDAFSASCILIVKYLDPERLAGWLDSALRIADPFWRAGWIVCLAGAAPVLIDGAYPSALDSDGSHPAGWLNAHLLEAPSKLIVPDALPAAFVDAERRQLLQASLRRSLDRRRVQQWGADLRQAGAPRGEAFEYVLWQYDSAAEAVAERYRLD